MAGRVYEADLTVPAGTAAAAPISAVWALDQGTLIKVRIVVPSGHNGLTGIRVLWAGTPIIPYAGAAYIVANNEQMEWEINQEVNIGSVSIQAYNTDIYPHSFYLRGLLTGLGQQRPASVTVVPSSQAPAADTLADIASIGSFGDVTADQLGSPLEQAGLSAAAMAAELTALTDTGP